MGDNPQDSMDKLHGAGPNLAALTSYSWNVFRYLGDYLHLGGVVVLLLTMAKNQSCAGLSMRSQILYFIIFVTRYLDLFDHTQTAYLVFFKLTYIITSGIALMAFYSMQGTYERHKDTCNLVIILVPCFTAALLLTNEYSTLEVLWTYSEFLEGFAMVPQYIFCYRDTNKDVGVTSFVVALGGYRVFYAMNWIYKKINMPQYMDIQSWIGGLVEIAFFLDYLNYRFRGASILRSMVLQVDEKINEISDKVELKVLGTQSSNNFSKDGQQIRRRRGAGAGDEEGLEV
mmetsp:Transcript_3800/g.5859  ORF Transcript_3800/g.5859 Transcript_3800/m.5859 type:complete len:286 (-) Transcript_3800:170-1027(-)